MASKKNVSRSPKSRSEKPVNRIEEAAALAGLTPGELYDGQKVGLLRGDLNLAVHELQTAFDEMIQAEFFLKGYERDSQVLSVLRRVRNAQNVIGCAS